MTQTGSVTKRLEGKIAVITGGNSGIGLATTHGRFVQEGAYIFNTPQVIIVIQVIGVPVSFPTVLVMIVTHRIAMNQSKSA